MELEAFKLIIITFFFLLFILLLSSTKSQYIGESVNRIHKVNMRTNRNENEWKSTFNDRITFLMLKASTKPTHSIECRLPCALHKLHRIYGMDFSFYYTNGNGWGEPIFLYSSYESQCIIFRAVYIHIYRKRETT